MHRARENPTLSAALALTGAALLGGCITVRPVVIDRKTELENQILGSFERLERELILASSVRGGGAVGARLSPLQREALEALLRREFNRDDIEALKAQQMLGEGNDGLLKQLAPAAAAAAGSAGERGRRPASQPASQPAGQREDRVAVLVEQDNADRLVIMRRVIQLDRQLTDKDLPQVRRIFARLMAQTAEPGHQVQLVDGRWRTVPAGEPRKAQSPAGGGAGQ